MMCNRLKVVLTSIVDEVKSDFVENVKIMHDILICQDKLKHYKRKSKPARCTLKVDLRKAYDFVTWDFNKELVCSFLTSS